MTIINNVIGQQYPVTESKRYTLDSGGVIVPTTDVSNYKAIYITATNVDSVDQYCGLFVSNNGTDWVQLQVLGADGSVFSTIGDQTAYHIPVNFKYFRVEVLIHNLGGPVVLDVVLSSTDCGPTTSLYVDLDSIASNAAQLTGIKQDTSGIFNQLSTGGSTYKRISTAGTNGVLVNPNNRRLMSFMANNTNAAVRYLKFYNKATAPTVGTDVPVFTIAMPPNGAFISENFDPGASFPLGIGIGMTTGIADTDTGAVAANEIVVNLTYK